MAKKNIEKVMEEIRIHDRKWLLYLTFAGLIFLYAGIECLRWLLVR